jgi:hypothetical protein
MSTSARSIEEMTPLEAELEELRARFPGSTIAHIGGPSVVSVPGVRLPPGWSQEQVTVHFLVPVGYPHANPDCFNVDEGLRLVSGAMPQSAQHQPMPVVGNTLWFSWHLQKPWKPGRDTLLTWMGVITARLADAR